MLPGVFITAYHASPFFKQRVQTAFQEIINYDRDKVALNQSVISSVGARILFVNNSLDVIKENSLLGVGTGDFSIEYQRINVINSPSSPNTTNPHNMYILVLIQSGIVGLLSMISIFYYQIKLSFKESNRFFHDLGFALPLLFLVIMLSDSYLLGHYTSLLFVFCSSFLYKNFEKD